MNGRKSIIGVTHQIPIASDLNPSDTTDEEFSFSAVLEMLLRIGLGLRGRLVNCYVLSMCLCAVY